MSGPVPRRTQAGGFSLIEVIIAIGIFTFCIVSIVYLLGVALESSRQSQIDSAMTGILRNMDFEVRSLPYTNASGASLLTVTNAGTNFFFDSVGNLTTNDAQKIYRANLVRVSSSDVATLTSVSNSVSGNISPGATNSTNHYLWVLNVAYPAPSYPNTNRLLLGRTLMGSGISPFYE